MTQNTLEKSAQIASPQKHPKVASINDVITFRLQRLVAIGERAGHHWSERMFDVSLNEWRLLALVVAHAPTRAGDMADALLMDKSQLSRVIKSMICKKFIRNTADPDDGRAIALQPTAEGLELYDRMLSEVLRSNERVLAPLSHAEIEAFNATLEKLLDHTQQMLDVRLAEDRIKAV
ncbi:MarR family winged helix-turn-helix transcriptional regulator [Sulfitobacter sp. JB4-11]|uniref:MarR family winged helix-turn-helix transcriptional regulator n=1 Tax=Sulfitobacter rhodophyticola TaxID=3238304 RepID=UPI0035123E9E